MTPSWRLSLLLLCSLSLSACSCGPDNLPSGEKDGGGGGGKPDAGGGGTYDGGYACGPATCLAPRHCGVSGDCLPENVCQQNEDCAGGKICRLTDGQCVPGSECGAVELASTRVVPNLFVTVDRSCSMRDLVGTKTKWQIAVDALTRLTTQYKGQIQFGLGLFPDITGDKCGQDATAVPLAAGTEAKIQDLLARSLNPADPLYPDFPCVTNIDTGVQQAAADPGLADAAHPGYVLLMTDGKQAGCSLGGGNAGVKQTLNALKARDVKTFVVGFGAGVDVAQMNAFALAGGVPSADPVTRYYTAEDQATLDAALQKIAQRALSCRYVLAQTPPDASKLFVFFDNTKEVARDPSKADGWEYDPSQNAVEFYGAACDDLSSGRVADLDIVFGCKAPVIN